MGIEISNQELEQKLLSFPHSIFKWQQEEIKLQQIVDTLKVEYEQAYNLCFLQAKATDPDRTVKELEAMSSNATTTARLIIVEAEAKTRAAKIRWEEFKNALNAAQSVIKMRVAEMEHISG